LHNQELIASQSIGETQENLSKAFVEKIPILKPTDDVLEMKEFKIIIDQKLSELKNLLLSKLAAIES